MILRVARRAALFVAQAPMRHSMCRLTAALLLLASLVSGAHAESDTPRARLAEILARQHGVERVEGRFLQTRHSELLTRPLVSAGAFLLEAPAQARWVIENPEAMILEVEGGRVRAGRPGALHAIDDPGAARGLVEMLGLFLGDNNKTLDEFEVRAGADANTFVLLPRAADTAAQIREMQVTIDPASGGPQTLLLIEKDGGRAELRFLDVEVTRMERARSGS